MSHYTPEDLAAALEKLPIEKGDILFLHSNIGFFGRAEGVADKESLCGMFFDALMQRMGCKGTVVVPSFTYSFPRRQTFELSLEAPEMGLFAEWIRQRPEARRSLDPSYSVAAIGDKADLLTEDAPQNSFSKAGFFGRFAHENGLILNLNFDAGSTFLHYLEREMDVPYRFDKTFEGVIRNDGMETLCENTIYVRYLSSDLTAPAFEPFHREATERGYFKTQPLGRGSFGSIRAGDCDKLLADILPQRPWFLTAADGYGVIPKLLTEPDFVRL